MQKAVTMQHGLQASTFPGVLANAKAGDYMIMECGYNDANYSSEAKMATALEEIADDCEKAGITLILSTPNFGAARGDTNKADVKFGPKILEVAKEKGVLGVNLSGLGYADYTAQAQIRNTGQRTSMFTLAEHSKTIFTFHISVL